MRTTLQFIIILLASISLWTTSAEANCLVFAQNERLSNYCLLNEVSGKLMDGQTASVVVQRLQREGYFGGISEPTWATKIAPSVTYSNNINGGNPDKKLVLGNLEFDGDPNLVAKEGVVGNLNLSALNRVTFGEGRYVTTSLGAGYSYSPKHKLSFANTSFNFCSKNKTVGELYIDLCGSTHTQSKKLARDELNSINVAFNHLSHLKNIGYADWSLGLTRNFHDDYVQYQLTAAIDLIHEETWFGSFGLRIGEALPDQLALNFGVDTKFSRYVADKKLTFQVSYEHLTGGKLFGMPRTDESIRVTAVLPITEDHTASIGFFQSDSNIDYFDTNYPIISLTHEW